MSTKAIIGVVKNDKIFVSYVSHDGYPAWVGKTLIERYNDKRSVLNLIGLGDLCSLDVTLDGCERYEADNQTLQERYVKNEEEFRKLLEKHVAFGYIWDNGTGWSYTDLNYDFSKPDNPFETCKANKAFVSLENVLKEDNIPYDKNKYFVFSDVHGHLTELKQALKRSGYNANDESHWIVSLGDNFDRGDENVEMYNFLKKNKRKILVKGNHEDLLLKLIERKCPFDMDYSNGTMKTFYAFDFCEENPKPTLKKRNREFVEFVKNMINYYEIGDTVLTHAFIPIGIPLKDASEEQLYQSRWTNLLQLSQNILANKFDHNKRYIVGHFGAWQFRTRDVTTYNELNLEYGKNPNLFDTFVFEDSRFKKGLYLIDGATIISKKINILILNSDGTIFENNKTGEK